MDEDEARPCIEGSENARVKFKTRVTLWSIEEDDPESRSTPVRVMDPVPRSYPEVRTYIVDLLHS